MEDVLRFGFAILILVLAVFTLGAALGWGSEARNPRVLPTWIWAATELVQLAIVAWLFVSGWGWLAVLTAGLWLVKLVVELRVRTSGGREGA